MLLRLSTGLRIQVGLISAALFVGVGLPRQAQGQVVDLSASDGRLSLQLTITPDARPDNEEKIGSLVAEGQTTSAHAVLEIPRDCQPLWSHGVLVMSQRSGAAFFDGRDAAPLREVAAVLLRSSGWNGHPAVSEASAESWLESGVRSVMCASGDLYLALDDFPEMPQTKVSLSFGSGANEMHLDLFVDADERIASGQLIGRLRSEAFSAFVSAALEIPRDCQPEWSHGVLVMAQRAGNTFFDGRDAAPLREVAAVLVLSSGWQGRAAANPQDAEAWLEAGVRSVMCPNGELYLALDTFPGSPEAASEPPPREPVEDRPDEMVKIEAGLAAVGCELEVDGNCGVTDMAPDRVRVSEFSVGLTEVTVNAYRACVQAGACTDEGLDTVFWSGSVNEAMSRYCNYTKADRGRHPVNCVDYTQAEAYCAWRGYRLPSDAEWDRATRGDGRRYPWGTEPVSCERAIVDDRRATETVGGDSDGCGRDSTWPVGSKPAGASAFGVMDTIGNVWEWVVSAPPAVRGGAWTNSTGEVRSASRMELDRDARRHDVGFRCVEAAPLPSPPVVVKKRTKPKPSGKSRRASRETKKREKRRRTFPKPPPKKRRRRRVKATYETLPILRLNGSIAAYGDSPNFTAGDYQHKSVGFGLDGVVGVVREAVGNDSRGASISLQFGGGWMRLLGHEEEGGDYSLVRLHLESQLGISGGAQSTKGMGFTRPYFRVTGVGQIRYNVNYLERFPQDGGESTVDAAPHAIEVGAGANIQVNRWTIKFVYFPLTIDSGDRTPAAMLETHLRLGETTYFGFRWDNSPADPSRGYIGYHLFEFILGLGI